ncbi:phytochelatin synthase family protein [Dapis sp. BLCC M229]|uniref:phytochelatin synthase family protein n=1 Tax=Dapis sp. BLCC M229 TaxID=3400188 RepID=UPI003CEBA77C
MRDLDNIKLTAFQQPIRCCNVTAVAYAMTALGFSVTIDDIFYVTKLPIASVLDDGMTLAETYDTCLQYVENTNLPLTVSMEYFDNPSMTIEEFVESLQKAVSDPDDIHILNFNTKIAHDNPNLEGGHFSLVADYNPDSQEITVADTNPKRYTRFWKCPIERMYKACVDKDSASERSRGMIILRKNHN